MQIPELLAQRNKK